MRTVVFKFVIGLYAFIFNALSSYSQDIKTVAEALNRIEVSKPPYRDTKNVLRPYGRIFPNNISGISDKIYNDLQNEKIVYHAYVDTDFEPSLYWRYKVSDTDFQLGVLSFGGTTDWRIDRMFVSDQSGAVKDCIDVVSGIFGREFLAVLQYELTTDYKIITYRLVPTSSKIIMYDEILGEDDESRTVECYRLDTTYRINSSGLFEKESEQKHPVKAYTVKEMYEKNVWEL